MDSEVDLRAPLRQAGRRAAELLSGTTSAQLALAALAEAVDPDAIPAPLRAPAVALLERAPVPEPLAFDRVERLLRAAWGKRPARVLDELDPTAAAVTPAAVVHRGVIDWRPVAVKVRRPGLAEAVRADLGLLDAMAALAGGVLPRLDAGALAREVRERVLDELDLEYEGSVQRSFARALRRHRELHVPAVRSQLTHEAVLVSEWVDGVPLAELRGDDARRAAALLVRFHLGAPRFGTVHADPDPRDALLMADGRLAILDFGATRRVVPERVELAAAALDALAADDEPAFAAALDAIGCLPAADGPRALALVRRVLGPLLDGPGTLDAPAAAAAGERALAHEGELLELASRMALAPEDLWPLRMVAGLLAALARVGTHGDWLALAQAALRDGWDGATRG
jgi:predicted unusual protein kinase regulating ubiquinone biosynthesis (AarF/ABC1/UbiB family)